MTIADRRLRWLLRVVGILMLLAVFAVAMPTSWMAATHAWLGLGKFPDAPIVLNLARSVSAFYAIVGALCCVLASDVDRYRPLVRFLGVAFVALGMALVPIDVTAGMPAWWSASEGPSTIVIGVLVLVWARADG